MRDFPWELKLFGNSRAKSEKSLIHYSVGPLPRATEAFHKTLPHNICFEENNNNSFHSFALVWLAFLSWKMVFLFKISLKFLKCELLSERAPSERKNEMWDEKFNPISMKKNRTIFIKNLPVKVIICLSDSRGKERNSQK